MLDAIFSYFENSTAMLKLIVNIDIHLHDRKNKVEKFTKLEQHLPTRIKVHEK